jgi:hypothetical protein
MDKKKIKNKTINIQCMSDRIIITMHLSVGDKLYNNTIVTSNGRSLITFTNTALKYV